MRTIIIAAILLLLAGCSNYQIISEGKKFTSPDGVETYVTLYRDDVNPLSDGVVAVIVKECHIGKGDHHVLPGTRKHEGKYHCGPSKTTVGIIPGIVRSIVSIGGFFTRHSGKPYAEGDNTNINSGSSSGAGAKSNSSARSKSRAGKKPPRKNKGH